MFFCGRGELAEFICVLVYWGRLGHPKILQQLAEYQGILNLGIWVMFDGSLADHKIRLFLCSDMPMNSKARVEIKVLADRMSVKGGLN